MFIKKILLVFILLFFSSTTFAVETETTVGDMFSFGKKTKESPFLKLPEILGNGTIINFTSYNVLEFRQILYGNIESQPIKITGHLTFPIGDGTSIDKFPVLIILHDSLGPAEFLNDRMRWFRDIQRTLLENGIGVFYIDRFSGRGVKQTYRDKDLYEDMYKVTMISQAIDAVMAYIFLKDHPKVDASKIGITGSSRGGTIPFIVADKKFTKNFLDDDEGFAALLAMSPECKISGLFENPEMTKNSKMLVVQGTLDEVSSCIEYVEKIKKNGGDIEIDLKEGWHRNFVWNVQKTFDRKYNFNNCPPYYLQDNGDINDEMIDFFAKIKAWKTKKDYYEDLYENSEKTFHRMMKKIKKKSECIEFETHYGGKHGKEFTPQFIGFFAENLL